MSTSYYVYAEVNVGKKWYNMNPLIRKHDGSWVLRPIYVGCSSFFEIYNYMEQNMTSFGIPEDMSPELRSVFHNDLDEPCGGYGEKTTWREVYERELFIVPYSKGIAPRVKRDRPHMFQGYVDKRSIIMYENDEIEEINCWLDSDEYAVLSGKEKRKYRFYEWDEPYSDYEVFRVIHERINAMLYWFDFADAFENRREYWDNVPSLSDVRVIVERS